LQKHVTPVGVIVEVMDVINDQDRRATTLPAVMQSHFFELVEGYRSMSDGFPGDNMKSYPFRYPMQDRLRVKPVQ
jgi:hypothetical protein